MQLSEFEELARRHRRWGRWGADDELGALNFITPEVVARACGLPRIGRTISCALALSSEGPQTGHLGRTNPVHYMVQDGGDIALGAQDDLPQLRYTDDALSMPLQSATHWDAFSHVFHQGAMYNGFGLATVPSSGAQKGGVEAFRSSLVSRGVLLDAARHRGVRALEPGYGIGAEELAACAAAEGVELESGDILLVRTGHLSAAREAGWGEYAGGDAPGLNLSTAELLFEREIAAVATDTWGVEVRPNETADVYQPLHIVLLVNAGVVFGEMLELDELADACAETGTYEFLFVAPPLPVVGGVGAPMNPIAIL